MTMDANLVVSRREGALLVPNRALRATWCGWWSKTGCTAAR